jgi:hypothetical protein
MKRLLLAVAAAAALWGAACSGGSTVAPPPPVGGYTVASLNGQYVFTTSGEVFNGSAEVNLARTGVFNANGQGSITGGVEDVNASGTVTPAVQISGGSYTVNADGRGTLTLNLNANGTASAINFAIVLTSTNDGLMIDETSSQTQASTGSGNFTKQTGGPFTLSSVTGPYVFDFAGLDGSQANLCPCPESFIGQFDVNNAAISSGFFDDNDNFQLANGSLSGTFAEDNLNPTFPISTFGRGLALIGGQNFAFYIVDATRVRFISTNGGMLSGDAVAQNNSIPTTVAGLNSSFAYLVAGTSFNGGLTRIGRFTAAGSTISNVHQDSNDATRFIATDNTTNTSITLDPVTPGRGTLTFTDPNFKSAPSIYIFYLSSASQGVIQETTVDSTTFPVAVADGTIAAQVGGPFSTSNITGTYAYNWSGLSSQQGGNANDEEDLLGQATVASLAFTGTDDIFQFSTGAPQTNLAASGTISIGGSDGTTADGNRNTMIVIYNKSSASASTVNCIVYFVSPQLAFFANSSSSATRIVAGILQAQQTP